MMEHIQIPGDANIVALSYTGTITKDDITRSYALIKPALATGKPVCLYVEMLDGFDIEASAMFEDLRRSPEVLRKLKQFQRVAIVTNQDWLRAVVQLEDLVFSLFTSDIELNVYTEDERDQAMAWTKGETRYSHGPAVTQIATGHPNIAAFQVDGKIRAEDMEFSKKMMTEFLTDAPPRRLMAKIKNLQGLQLSTLFDTQMIQMKREARKHLDRYALVGGPQWLRHLARSFAPMFDFEIRTFELEEEDEAWQWLKAEENVPA